MTTTIAVKDESSIGEKLMLLSMIDRVKERMNGWSVELIDDFPSLLTLHEVVTLGSFAWSAQGRKHKWIKKFHAVDYGGGWVTPADIARDYLALKYPDRRKRITTDQYNKCVRDRPQAPLYAEPCTLDHALYVDLVGAYWQIINVIGWDVNYNPNKFLGVNSNNGDFPFKDHKLARNCLVSSSLPSTLRMWDGEKLVFKSKPNRFINLLLWRAVCDVLHGVAAAVVAAGAKYVHTDGYIVPMERASDVFSAIDNWHLRCAIKHEGACEIRGAGNYTFPSRQSGHKRTVKPRGINNIDNRYSQWLLPRFRRMSERTIEIE